MSLKTKAISVARSWTCGISLYLGFRLSLKGLINFKLAIFCIFDNFDTYCIMDRQSWGLEKPPTGSPLAAPPRPNTASRSALQGNLGQNLGPVHAPPGTARMSAAARMGTALGPRGMQPRGDIQVLERPVTQGGLAGLKTAGGGQGRQVLDVQFFLNELRYKKQELISRNSKMKVGLLTSKKYKFLYHKASASADGSACPSSLHRMPLSFLKL